MSEEHPIKQIAKADGTRRVSIMERQDGHYRFVEDSQITEDGDTYWTPTHWSGIYETSEAAERDAIATFPWARAEQTR